VGSEIGIRDTDKPGQYVIGRNPGTAKLEVSKDGGEVDAITASTITSRAFLEALNRAHAGFAEKILPELNKSVTTP